MTQRTLGSVKALALGLLAALMSASIMLAAEPAHAGQTFEVNNTGDPLEGDPNFGLCNVNFCTLRTAIVAANNHPGPDTIEFNIPRADQRSINPVDELPKITEAVTIDGYSQILSRPNTEPVGFDGNLQVHLHGSKAGGGASRLRIEADSVIVRGLIIDGFDGSGIAINGSGNRIEGNYIGTDRFGTGALGNGFNGVAISDSTGNTVGRGEAGANLIAFNKADGVAVRDLAGSLPETGNSIRSNSIFANGDLGIDLGLGFSSGPTPNDPLDPDTGPNDLQNKPNLTSAATSGGKTTVTGKLNSTPDKTFLLEFFSNPSGTDEGKKFMGEKQVTTNLIGKGSFTFEPQMEVPVGQTVTATATGSVRNTSEFSAPRVVVAS